MGSLDKMECRSLKPLFSSCSMRLRNASIASSISSWSVRRPGAGHACSRRHVGQVPGQAQIGVQEPPDVHLENLYIPAYTLVKKGYLVLNCVILTYPSLY
jgi:hypothetical protein